MKPHDPMTVPRPATLEEVAVRTLGGEPFDPLLREFLDTFYLGDSDTRGGAIGGAPVRIDPLHDAYLAAVAEHLALRFRLSVPQWVEEPHRFLTRPFFAGGLESLKAILLVESRELWATRSAVRGVTVSAMNLPLEPVSIG